jgi:hypothetical protein
LVRTSAAESPVISVVEIGYVRRSEVMYGTVSALALMLAVTGGANAAGTDQAALAASATARQAEKRKHRAMAAARLNHCFKSLAALAFDFFGRHSRPSNSL